MPLFVLAEVEPATRPDLTGVRRQIAVLAPVVDAFLIPDNHLGRATVSSLAVAHEVAAMGGRSVACLNARDRNHLGLQRDLLTAAAYGVTELLLVRGDPSPHSGDASLRVSHMIDEIRAAAGSAAFAGRPPFRIGVTAAVGSKLPAWKREADFLVSQVCFEPAQVSAWRETIEFDGQVLAGVLVPASAGMARRLASGAFGITIPAATLERLDRDGGAGVDIAMECIDGLAAGSAIDGVHLVSGVRYREAAMSLLLRRSSPWP